jgi:Tfp pilus assembly ATPase PilU
VEPVWLAAPPCRHRVAFVATSISGATGIVVSVPFIKERTNEGLQTFDQARFARLQRKAIGQDDAFRFADSPNNLRLRMKGIR